MPELDKLESKALWLLAVHGTKDPPLEIMRDAELGNAGERAITKVWREHRGYVSVGPLEYVGLLSVLYVLRGFVVGVVVGGALAGLILR